MQCRHQHPISAGRSCAQGRQRSRVAFAAGRRKSICIAGQRGEHMPAGRSPGQPLAPCEAAGQARLAQRSTLGVLEDWLLHWCVRGSAALLLLPASIYPLQQKLCTSRSTSAMLCSCTSRGYNCSRNDNNENVLLQAVEQDSPRALEILAGLAARACGSYQ